MAMRSEVHAPGPAAGGRLPPAPPESIFARMKVAGTGAALCLMVWAAPAAAVSFCTGQTDPAPADAPAGVGEMRTLEVIEPARPDAGKPPASASIPKGGRACDETVLAGYAVAAVLVRDSAGRRPKPGAAFAGPADFPVPQATTDGRLRVDLYVMRLPGTEDRAAFDCTRTLVAPSGSADGPADIGCETRSIPASASGFRAANFALGLWHHADDLRGLWQVRIGLRDQTGGKRAELVLAYPFGEAP